MKICFVTPRFPFPVIKGDTLRAYHQIRELSRNHKIHLIAASETDVSHAALNELKRYCSGIDVVKIGRVRSFVTVAALGIASQLPLQVLYFRAPALKRAVEVAVRRETFDVIHAMTVRVAPAVLGATDVPVVVDFMDSFGANVATRRNLVGPFTRRVYDFELARVTAYERKVAERAAGGFVIAELDRETIGVPGLAVIANGVDSETFPYHEGPRDAATLVFTGNMGYHPNVDAVTWFAAECWPQLLQTRPHLRLLIVGARPASAVVALGRLRGVEVTGRVDSMVPYLHRATVAICPIRCGSGMQNKLLEAMSTGVPVITTQFANRGIGAVPGRDLQAAGSASEFSELVLRLLSDKELRVKQARAARRWVEETYGWSRHATALADLYLETIASNTARTKSSTSVKKAG